MEYPTQVVADACPSDDVLGALVQRELDAAEAASVTSHLDTCSSCRQIVIAAVRGGMAVPQTPMTLAIGTPTFPPVPRARTAAPELTIGSRVGRYELRELLGSGGMGRVYAAFDAELDRSIALKVMRPDLARRANVLADRLVRESQLMAKIVHPAVIAVHDVGRVDNAVFIAMDLVRGETLGAYVRRAKPDWREALALLAQAGEGLAAAHARGVVHRDFKPDNVLVELDADKRPRRVVVTDFGVARAFADDPEAPDGDDAPVLVDLRLTATGTAVGTPAYMAPEHIGHNAADQRADVWAFAVTAWELLFGSRPFPGRSVEEIKKALADRPVPPRSSPVPPRIVRALERGLAFDAANRWPDMPSFLRALAPEPRGKKRVIAAAALGAVALAGLGLGIGRLTGGDTPPATPVAAAATDPCARALAALDDAYDASRAAAVARALDADPKTRDALTANLAKFADQWRATMRSTCAGGSGGGGEDIAIESTQDAHVRPSDATRACLAARRLELAAFVDDVVADGGRHAARLAKLVGDPTACAKPTPSMLEARVPADRDLRRKVTALRYRGFDAEDARDRGDYKVAIAAAAKIVDDAKAVWEPLEAEALYLLGTAQGQGGDNVRALATMRDAAALAERVHHDYIAAQAWIQLAQGTAFDAGEPARALEYLAYADAAVARIKARPDTLAMLDYVRGTTLIEADRASEGEVALRRAMATAEAGAPELIPIMTQGLGYFYEDRGRHEEAVAAYRRALSLEPKPPPGTEVIFRDRLAINLNALGKNAEAQREARTALALAEKHLGEDNLDRAVAHTNLAQVLEDGAAYDAALAEAELGVRAIAKIAGERNERYGEAAALVGAILNDLERFAEAEKRLARACEIIAFAVGDGTSQQAECWFHEAVALSGLGRSTEALALAEKMIAPLEKAYGTTHPQVANAYVTRGGLHAELGHHAQAVADLDKARAMFAAMPLEAGHLAAVEWALGKELWTHEPARAKKLVEGAVARFAGAGPTWAATRKDAETWLATHP